MKKRIIEKNIEEFNQDIKNLGGYSYNNRNIYSAAIASKKQLDELTNIINYYCGKEIKGMSILDVGSGDGVCTLELFKALNPKIIVGFDYAKDAINFAKKNVPKKYAKKIKFVHCNIYSMDKKIENKFDLIVVRSLLHHLYNVEKAIYNICQVGDRIIIIEPNGYSPILKIFEKVSLYHRKHEEKSYWPHYLNRLFKNDGLRLKKYKYFGVVPYFSPKIIASVLKNIEPLLENVPLLKMAWCSNYIGYYEKE